MNYLKNCQIDEVKRKCIVGKSKENDEDYCLICYEYILEPVNCQKCRGYFCRKCAQNWKNISKRCPKRCSEGEWKLVQMEMVNNILKCPFGSCPGIFQWNDWEYHLKRCFYMPEEVRQRVRIIETRKCQKQHNLIESNKKAKCSDCDLFTTCLSECLECKQQFCNSCRHPNLHKAVCPNMHQYKNVKTSFSCSLCHRYLINKQAHQDKDCQLMVCQDCYKSLPSYPDEEQIIRSFRCGRKYSA